MPPRTKDNYEDGSPQQRAFTGRTRERDRHGQTSRGSGNKRSTTKDRDRDKDRDKEKNPRRRVTSREGSGRHSNSSTSSLKDQEKKRKDSAVMQGQDTGGEVGSSDSRPVSATPPAAAESKTSLPYPAFSKAHSKEAVGDRDKLGGKLNVLTPEPTDLADGPNQKHHTTANNNDDDDNMNGNSEKMSPRKQTANANANASPPSPPLTNDAEPSARRRSTPTVSKRPEYKGTATVKGHDDEKHRRPRPQSSRASSGSLKKTAEQHARSSGKTSANATTGKFKILDALQFPRRSSSSTQHVSSPKQKSHDKADHRRSAGNNKPPPPSSPRASTATARSADADDDSDATYIAPNQVQTSQPAAMHATNDDDPKKPPGASPAPPPPPPPPHVPPSMPKVDYLLQCGGLGYCVPRNFLGAGESANMPQELLHPEQVGHQIFEPFSTLLDDYGQVMTKNGSLAVATGYRSVARRLLDRLEAVFSRDISSETCGCLMCSREGEEDDEYPREEASGVSWGEILELVSGRQEFPPWPPFSIGSEADATVGISVTEQHVPMQKLDIDVPEEFREHYIRQSRKTKDFIDKWLSRQPHQSSSPPEDTDDETLAFAMLTYLDEEQRDLFKGLLEMPTTPPAPKKETPKPKERPQILVLSGHALQRLYRLVKPPRDPETALYMVGNPQMHHVLATLAAISNDEWDILISGRFDGFLRSGAEDDCSGSANHTRPLTGHTSAPPSASRPLANGKASRSSTTRGGGRASADPERPSSAASFGAPISVDEESEIATLAEIERDIFLGMEALEDAFETLHVKAESVRRAVRERGAGLTAARARRGVDSVEVLTKTPTPTPTSGSGETPRRDDESVTDDGMDDAVSIAPSDSASNVSSSRRRRPKRRTERRTPSAVEEEDEEN